MIATLSLGELRAALDRMDADPETPVFVYTAEGVEQAITGVEDNADVGPGPAIPYALYLIAETD